MVSYTVKLCKTFEPMGSALDRKGASKFLIKCSYRFYFPFSMFRDVKFLVLQGNFFFEKPRANLLCILFAGMDDGGVDIEGGYVCSVMNVFVL